MSDIVEFILRAKDELSKPLHGAARESDQAARSFDKLSKEEKELDKIMSATGDSAKKLEDRLKSLREYRDLIPEGSHRELKRVNGELERMEGKLNKVRTMGRKGGGRGISGMSNIADGALSAMPGMGGLEFLPLPLMAALAGLTGGAALFRSGAKREFERAQFTNEFGSSGSDLLDRMRNTNPMLGDGARSSARLMARSGMGNNLIENTLTRLGDVSNGDDERLSSLAATMAMINKEGKLTEETLTALEENGFNPLLEISENTNRSFDRLFDDLDKGKISAFEVTNALRTATEEGGRFFGNMERLSETAIGNWKRMTDSLSDSFGELGEDFASKVMGAYDGVLSAGGFLKPDNAEDQDVMNLIKNLFTGGNESYSWEQQPKGKTVNPAFDAFATIGQNTNSPMLPGPWADDATNKQRELEEAKARRAEEEAAQSERINAVSGGGMRNITINIEKMIERVSNTFTNGGTEEFAGSLEQVAEEALVRALQSAAGR